MNLFEQQAANRRKSRLLVAAFMLFFAWLGFGGDFIAWQYTSGAGPGHYRHIFPWFGTMMALVALGLVMNIRRTGAAKVLWSTGAWELIDPDSEDQRKLVNVTEEMAIAAGVTRPKIHIIDDPDPNAFVTGTDPMRPHLAVTTGLVSMLDRDELQAVVAHEMGHVKNLDMTLMTMVAGLAGAIALIADGTGRVLRHGRLGGSRGGGGGGGRGGKGGNPLLALLLVLWLLSWLLAPLVTRLLAMGISRKREYLADAMAAQFTRNPMSLATALEKIEHAGAPTRTIKGGVAHLCIADPLGRRVSSAKGALGDLFATHPPMSMRVARLKAMAFRAEKSGGDFGEP
jgi:heat shock protein HtpX